MCVLKNCPSHSSPAWMNLPFWKLFVKASEFEWFKCHRRALAFSTPYMPCCPQLGKLLGHPGIFVSRSSHSFANAMLSSMTFLGRGSRMICRRPFTRRSFHLLHRQEVTTRSRGTWKPTSRLFPRTQCGSKVGVHLDACLLLLPQPTNPLSGFHWLRAAAHLFDVQIYVAIYQFDHLLVFGENDHPSIGVWKSDVESHFEPLIPRRCK